MQKGTWPPKRCWVPQAWGLQSCDGKTPNQNHKDLRSNPRVRQHRESRKGRRRGKPPSPGPGGGSRSRRLNGIVGARLCGSRPQQSPRTPELLGESHGTAPLPFLIEMRSDLAQRKSIENSFPAPCQRGRALCVCVCVSERVRVAPLFPFLPFESNQMSLP